MEIHTNSQRLNEALANFTQRLQAGSDANLKSIILYGGVAKKDYTEGRSNVNVLLVFDKVDLETLDQVALLIQQGMAEFKLAPFILTLSELKPSSDVFAVKLFDIKQHSQLIFGEDVLRDLTFDPAHLRFISEQELRNQLARMKVFYIQNLNMPELLLQKVRSGFTTLLVNANTYLYLKNGTYLATRTDIIQRLFNEPDMDKATLEQLQQVKDTVMPLSREVIRKAYDDLMLTYKQLIKLLKALTSHG